MESAGNGGVLKGRLQAFHVHILLVALLGAGYMAERAQISMRVELLSGKLPVMWDRRWISRL